MRGKTMKPTKQVILETLAMSDRPLALHELNITGISECSASARLREMARIGQVIGQRREGKSYKEWTVA